MNNQHYLRTKYLPFRPEALVNVQTNTSHTQPQTGHVVGQVYQNVFIGGGMMTKKVPVIVQPQGFVSPVTLIGASGHIVQPQGFVSPVTLIGANSHVIQQPSHGKNWSSAGTIIIEEGYRRRNGKTCQAIFLGQNPHTHLYELFYGKRDYNDNSTEHTAARETEEESCNMFVFSSHIYNQKYCVTSSNSKHHAFVIRVSAPRGGIQSSVFHTNRKILQLNNAPSVWTELSNISRIDISDAISSGMLLHNSGEFTMYDVYGSKITICARDAEFIADALRKSMHVRGTVVQLSFINSWDDRRVGGSKMYRDGTSTYSGK